MKVHKHKVLVVDDDKDILALMQYNLAKDGYQVKIIDDSTKALKAARSFSPDLVVLDVMMPELNGIELCRELRSREEFKNTYIFFLTAKSESYYQQAAFDTGADDYIEKLMGLRMLTYKISAVLKKDYVIRKRNETVTSGSLSLNRHGSLVFINDNNITLSKPEFELLYFFAQNPGKLIKKEDLLQYLWGSATFLTVSSIEKFIEDINARVGAEVIRQKGNGVYCFNG